MFQKGIASRGWWKPGASKRCLNITPELQPLKRNRCITSVKHRNIQVGPVGIPPVTGKTYDGMFRWFINVSNGEIG